MLPSIICRYQGDGKFLDMCSLLDPRVKSTPYLTDVEKAVVHDSIFNKIIADSKAQVTHTDTSSAATTETLAKTTLLSNLLGDEYATVSTSASTSMETVLNFELKRYVSEKPCSMSECPLLW